jgi:hypothetical protein
VQVEACDIIADLTPSDCCSQTTRTVAVRGGAADAEAEAEAAIVNAMSGFPHDAMLQRAARYALNNMLSRHESYGDTNASSDYSSVVVANGIEAFVSGHQVPSQ